MSLNNDDIKQLIAILQKGLTQEDTKESIPQINTEQSGNNTKKRKKVKKNNRDTDDTQSYNKFDSMPENNMHRDDSRLDRLLSKYPPSQRSREFQFVDVVCRLCGKKDSVNPALVNESSNRYKCNKCSRIPG